MQEGQGHKLYIAVTNEKRKKKPTHTYRLKWLLQPICIQAKPTSKHYCQKILCEVNVSNYTILKQYTASQYWTTKYRHDANQLHSYKYNIVKVWVTNSLQQFYLFLFILLFYHQINYSSYKKLRLFVVCVADKMWESYLN